MNPESVDNSMKIRLKPRIVDKTIKKSSLRFPGESFSLSTGLKSVKLLPKLIGEWNPFEQPDKCMICWKPLDFHGKDAKSYMECRHCGRKAHQNHMLRWLAKKNFCPYCQKKW
jgi:DNA-directed RNA polymerase subunit RPC12/RpoP